MHVAAHNRSDVYVWYEEAQATADGAGELAGQFLSAEEKTRRDRLHFSIDRNNFTIAHDLLRRSLSRYAEVPPGDWQFGQDANGKPEIQNNDPRAQALSFNLSHTRGCATCAIGFGGALGVDVERVDRSRGVQQIADRYFSETEAASLRDLPDALRSVRFTELWTLKEAFLKALGVGLSGALGQISFQIDEHLNVGFSAPATVDANGWHFALFAPFENVRLAVAVRSPNRPRFVICQDTAASALAARP